MPSSWIIEAVNVLKECSFNLASGSPYMSPDQFSLDGFEECLDGSVIIAITLAAHGYFEAVSPQSLLIIMGAILAAAICMMNAARRRSSKRDGHVESSYGQITLEPIADSPTDDAAGMQINHHRQI